MNGARVWQEGFPVEQVGETAARTLKHYVGSLKVSVNGQIFLELREEAKNGVR